MPPETVADLITAAPAGARIARSLDTVVATVRHSTPLLPRRSVAELALLSGLLALASLPLGGVLLRSLRGVLDADVLTLLGLLYLAGVASSPLLPRLLTRLLSGARRPTTTTLSLGAHHLVLRQGGRARRVRFADILFVQGGERPAIVCRDKSRVWFAADLPAPTRRWLTALVLAATRPRVDPEGGVPAALRALQAQAERR